LARASVAPLASKSDSVGWKALNFL